MHHKYTKPKNDDEYFERMSRVVFMTGLNWQVMSKKWPGIQNAFGGFKINKVANFQEPEIEELVMNPEVIRSLPKIRAVVANAKEMQKVIKEHGSFKKYLDKLRKDGGEAGMIKELSKRFAFMGKGTSVLFLLSVVEDVPNARQEWRARHNTG